MLQNIKIDTPIYLGESNIKHMKKSHPDDFLKYGLKLSDIILYPDYIGINPSDLSIEYVKEILIDKKFIKVAVRVSSNGTYFARSLYHINNKNIARFIKKGYLIKY